MAQTAKSDGITQEVVVTAEKREQSIQHVPVAISAFTSAKRDLIGISSVADLTNFTPGLQYSSQLDRISLRGIGRNSNVHAADAAVATYSDGIYTTSTVEAGKTPLFVDRVEVLRGPQGTLYGRNSIGGAINVISKRPTDDWYAEVRANYGNYNHSTLEGAVSGPTGIQGVDFRLAANWDKQTKGYIKNIVPGRPDEGNVIDTKLIEGQIKAIFNNRFDMWAKLSWANWDNGAGGPGSRATWTPYPWDTTHEYFAAGTGLNPGYGCSGRVTNVVNLNPQGCTNPALNNPRTIANAIPYKVKLDDTWIFANQWNFHGDGFDIRYLLGGTHYHYTLTGPNTADLPPITSFTLPGGLTVNPQEGFNYQELEQWWSHEINIASTNDGPLQWLVGGYYYNERAEQPVYTTDADPAWSTTPYQGTCAFTNNVCQPGIGRRFDDRPVTHIRDQAVFGQVDWNFTSAWKATVGLRYSENRKDGEEAVRIFCYAVNTCYAAPELKPFLPGGVVPLVDLTQIPSVVSNPAIAAGGNGVYGKGVGPTTYDPATGFAHRNYGASWSATTGTAGLQYEPDRNTLAYLRYSRGFKAGGFRVGIDTVLAPNPYTEAEQVDDIELGIKKTIGPFVFDLAVFHYDYKNDQIPLSIANTSGGLASSQSVFYNIPKAVSQGVELEMTWNPIPRMQILVDYSYLDATIKSSNGTIDAADPTAQLSTAHPIGPLTNCAVAGACAAAGQAPDVYTGYGSRGQNLSGNQLPNSPKNKVAVNILYTFYLPNNMGRLTPSLTYIYRDKQYGSIFNQSASIAPSWDQIDARLTWKLPGNHLTAIFYGKNLGNKLGYEGGAAPFRLAGATGPATIGSTYTFSQQGGVYSSYPLTPPRTYGIELQYKF
ncbi:MAG: TonB-dependent receptor [Pseudomonadota bacterium]|nr:TonB-dependent receptor [Pseudomonadota bacterium]